MTPEQKNKFWKTLEESGWDSGILAEAIIKIVEKQRK